MRTAARMVGVVGVAAGLASLPSRAQPPAPPGPEAELAAICAASAAGDLPWYGEARAKRLAAQLAAHPANPADEIKLHAQLGVVLIKLGRPGEAVETLQQGLALARKLDPDDPGQWGMVWFLGLSYLQLSEDQNCVERHNHASCILPLRPEAVHSRPEAARKAAESFLEMVKHEPRHIQAAWLFALSRMLAGDYPEGVPEGLRLPAAAFASSVPFRRFVDRAPELGVAAFDLAGGAVMDDFDGDGLLDLVSSTWDPCGSLKAYRNDGHGGFTEMTAAWGLAGQLGGLNLVHADYDNDGDLDLLVLRGGWMLEAGRLPRSLLRNDLNTTGRFVDVTRAAGLEMPRYPSQSAAWADYDGDGDLDLYVADEANSRQEPYPSLLFQNRGDGTFREVAASAGVTNDRFAKAAAWGDYDDDGDPDLYVSNWGPNRLYRNDGGHFTDVAPSLGVTAPEGRSFASWFFDFDNDGDLDLWVNDFDAPIPNVTAGLYGFDVPSGQPLLYRNDGGRFTEVSRSRGLTLPLLPMGSNYGDLDNDGWLDVYLGTGDPGYESVMPNIAYRNDGGRFVDVSAAAGLGHVQKGHGVAFGDLDNDGDQDVFHQLGGFYPGDAFANALFENPGGPEHWLTLRLVGTKANRFGVGARLAVRVREGERVRSIHLLAGAGGSFGDSSLQQEIGLGAADEVLEIVVRWPGSGTVDRIAGANRDRFYRLVEGSGSLEPLDLPRLQLGGQAAAHHRPR